MTDPAYTLLCPSRGRPDLAYQCAESALSRAEDPSRIEFLVYLDDDDASRGEYEARMEKLRANYGPQASRMVIGPRMGVPRAANVLAFAAKGEVIVTATDDQAFKSNGWDLRLDQETPGYPDQIFCMWFNDGWESERWCTAPIITRTWVRTVGYFCHPLFEHYYCDTWIWLLAKKLQRDHYISDVTVEHRHYKANTRSLDETDLLRGRDGGVAKQKRDHQALQVFQRYIQMDAALLKRVIDAYAASQKSKQQSEPRGDTITM